MLYVRIPKLDDETFLLKCKLLGIKDFELKYDGSLIEFDFDNGKFLEIYLVDTVTGKEEKMTLSTLLTSMSLCTIYVQNIGICQVNPTLYKLTLGNSSCVIQYIPMRGNISSYDCCRLYDYRLDRGGTLSNYAVLSKIDGTDKYVFTSKKGYYNKRRLKHFDCLCEVFAISSDGDSLMFSNMINLVYLCHKGKCIKTVPYCCNSDIERSSLVNIWNDFLESLK